MFGAKRRFDVCRARHVTGLQNFDAPFAPSLDWKGPSQRKIRLCATAGGAELTVSIASNTIILWRTATAVARMDVIVDSLLALGGHRGTLADRA
eukprot:3314573-Rhodomonas_salina.4